MAKKPCKRCAGIWRNKWGQCPTCIKAPPKPPNPLTTCIHCSSQFMPRYREKNLYCSVKCHDEFRVMKWLPCSICLAKTGIGSQTTGRILGIADSSVRRQWKMRGIMSDRPKSGSMIQEGRSIAVKARQQEEKNWALYERAWMDEIKNQTTFTDWSYIWYKEVSRIKSNNRYQNMSLSERRKVNQKLMRNRCPIKQRAKIKEWKRKTRIKNPAYRIIESFRTRLWMVAKGKSARTMNLVGCSLADFRSHIEKHFKHGMTWDNYGTHWHVDHTIPVSSFDHNNPKQLKQCWHWTNLRPMTATSNLRKGSRITQPQMELLLCAH